jgi:hypothetical protein
MAKRKRQISQKVIDKRIKEGRGQATGVEYQPWLRIQDVPSQGLVHRIKGWKTGRLHHLMSNLELNYFYVLEWSPLVVDIREQYPLLPLEETIELAEQCGVRHPTDPRSQEPIVMTTDFLITLQGDRRPIEQARTIKPAQQLVSERVQQKLEIERRYWLRRKIDWGIVTEREIPQTLCQNVALLHEHRELHDRVDVSDSQLQDLITVLTDYVTQGDVSLRVATSQCDRCLGFEPGTSLGVTYHLLATRRWLIDMNAPLEPGHPLTLLALSTAEIQPKKEVTSCNYV